MDNSQLWFFLTVPVFMVPQQKGFILLACPLVRSFLLLHPLAFKPSLSQPFIQICIRTPSLCLKDSMVMLWSWSLWEILSSHWVDLDFNCWRKVMLNRISTALRQRKPQEKLKFEIDQISPWLPHLLRMTNITTLKLVKTLKQLAV